MTDTIQNDSVDTSSLDAKDTNTVLNAVKELTSFEKDQQAKGWKPDGSKSAEEWAKDGELYEEIKARGRQIKQLSKTVDSLKQFIMDKESASRQRELIALDQQREAAIKANNLADLNRVDSARKKLEEEPQNMFTNDNNDDILEDFKEEHASWLLSDDIEHLQMQAWVGNIDKVLGMRKLPLKEHIQKLNEAIYKQYPEYAKSGTEKGQTDRRSKVESSAAASNGKTKTLKFDDLTPEQQHTAKMFQQRNIMSIEDYIKEISKMNTDGSVNNG